MDAANAMRYVVEQSGLTHKQVESRADRYGGWLGQTLSRPRPGADLLAEVARACGYRLELVPMDGGEPVTIGGDDMHEQTHEHVADQARALILRAAALLENADD